MPCWNLSSERNDAEDDVSVTVDELKVADGQANIFELINQCFGIETYYFFV